MTAAHTSTVRDLTGRAALVTGASRGIGKAVAAELLARGAKVTITARKPEPLEEAARELRESADDGAEVLAIPGNAGDADSRRHAVAATIDTLGSLDILVNNTGINPVYGSLMDADLDGVKKIFDTNVVATLGFVQEAFHGWMGEHGGAVVNVASVAGIRSTGVIAAYGASKAALIRLTEELAWQLGPAIRVNAVAPGVVKTRFAEALVAAGEEQAASVYPMKRLGTPEDVASLIGFLVSDKSSWITGETIRVDGGLLATGGM
ncbi:MAG: SDR family oxidoreductase [Rhodococcus sp. (in: high G+C Gram-positive bacteria)]